MAVDRDMVERVAKLARIKLSDSEADALVGELSAILNWVEELGEVDVSGVEPMSAVISKPMALRDDIVTEGGERAAVLANAPTAERGFFAVPKVIE